MTLTLALVVATALIGLSAQQATANEGINIGGSTLAGGSIKGSVKFEGKQVKRRKIKMSADPYCAKSHASNISLNEKFVFGDNNTLQNVFVWVSGGIAKGDYPPIHTKPLLDQTGCMYVPHVSGVVTGQEFTILNNDETLHNVKVNPKLNKPFNEGMPVKGMTLKKTFTKAEMGVHFKCDVHAWMSAFIHVVDHPFFAVTQQDGTFEIRGLPAGEYEVSVWHEFKRFAPTAKTIKVTVEAGKASDASFTYSPKKKKKK